MYVVVFAKFAAEVFFLLAELRSLIDVIFRVYVVLGNLFVRIGIGFAFFISAAAVCRDLTFCGKRLADSVSSVKSGC